METKITNKHEVILNFIEQFRHFGPAVEDCFSHGMCFHFANILWVRFGPDSYIVYDPIINHFACQIGGHVFDITGDITDDPQYKWVMWSKYMYEDPAHTKRIVRDCIWKIPHDLLICGICPKSFEDDHGNLICECDYSPVGLDDPCIFGYTPQEVEA